MPHEPWAGATYNGFSGPSHHAVAEPPPPAAHRGISRNTLFAGVGCALAAGLLFGLWTRPDHTLKNTTPPAPAPAAEAPVAQVPVEVVEPAPVPAPKATAPLEVLPPDLARAAEAARPVAPPAAVRLAPPPPARVVPARPAAPALPPVARTAPTPEREVAVAPTPRDAGPAFNCRYARSRSEAMVCGDSELAGLDRRLNRAFDRAVGSGVPYRALRREQDDWLSIREDAARRSPEAVASVYRQRIRELNAIADEGAF